MVSGSPRSQGWPAGMSRRAFHRAALSSLALGAVPRLGASAASPSDRIGLGVIGCGGRGTAHMRTLMALRAEGAPVEIVALCDSYRPRLDRAAALTGAGFVTMRHEELLARPEIDAVLVATPDHWHGPQTIDALRAGKDVYCEKPLTHWRQLGMPEEMLAVARATGRLVQVGCQRMSSSAYRQARALIEEGAIGQPVAAETGYYRLGDWGERGMPVDDPAAAPGPELDWNRFLGDAPRRDFDVSRYFRWRLYWDYSGGPATDNYVHFYTPLAYALNLGYPDQVVASGGRYRYEEREVPDTFNLIADYPQKLAVLCHGTQANDYQSPGTGDNPIIRGWDATLSFEGAELVIREVGDAPRPEKRVPIETGTSEPRFWLEFLECCRTRRQPTSDLELNAFVTTTLQMAIAALRERRVVAFDHQARRIAIEPLIEPLRGSI